MLAGIRVPLALGILAGIHALGALGILAGIRAPRARGILAGIRGLGALGILAGIRIPRFRWNLGGIRASLFASGRFGCLLLARGFGVGVALSWWCVLRSRMSSSCVATIHLLLAE